MPIGMESFEWDRLSLDEKLTLVSRLWDEIAASVPSGGLLSDPQRQELHRRVADAQAHPEDSVAWEDVLAATLKRLSP